MRKYSIAKVKGDCFGLGSFINTPETVEARNYDDAVERAIIKLHLKKGDTLSIIALQGSVPTVKGIGLPGRYEYEI